MQTQAVACLGIASSSSYWGDLCQFLSSTDLGLHELFRYCQIRFLEMSESENGEVGPKDLAINHQACHFRFVLCYTALFSVKSAAFVWLLTLHLN